jgi:hypothetical protein
MLADLKLSGDFEAVDEILADADRGSVTGSRQYLETRWQIHS